MKMQVNRRRTRIVITQGAKTDLLEQTVLRRSRIPTLKLIFSFRILHQLYIVFHESGVKRNAIFPKFTTMQAKKIFFILSENETKQRAIPSYDPRPFLRRNIVYRILKTASDYAECYISTRIYPSHRLISRQLTALFKLRYERLFFLLDTYFPYLLVFLSFLAFRGRRELDELHLRDVRFSLLLSEILVLQK